MTRCLFIISFFTLSNILCLGQSTKNIVKDKTYIRKVSTACKSFKDKGCLITTYESLTFKTDSMYAYYYTISDCDRVNDNILSLENEKNIKSYGYQAQKKRNSPNYIIRTNGYTIPNLEASSTQLIEFNNDPSSNNKKKVIFNLKK